jgi:hypothetical protein
MEFLQDMDFASEVFFELLVELLKVDGLDSYESSFLL